MRRVGGAAEAAFLCPRGRTHSVGTKTYRPSAGRILHFIDFITFISNAPGATRPARRAPGSGERPRRVAAVGLDVVEFAEVEHPHVAQQPKTLTFPHAEAK